MDVSLLVTFIETTIPTGVTFNQWGVAQKGLRHTFRSRKLIVTFDVCALNGLWAGEFGISTNLWGCGGPVTREDFKFTSFEECVSHLWKLVEDYIEKNKSNVSTDFLRFKAAMNRWLAKSSEEKFNVFEETDFYGS